MNYNFKKTEKKWQEKWEDCGVFHAQDNSDKKKFYGLVEFPYPSGAGMHVGHIKAYSGLEVISRKRRMEGYNVLFPIGFDAYGLPTENYAIKTGIHPRKVTDMNIEKFSSIRRLSTTARRARLSFPTRILRAESAISATAKLFRSPRTSGIFA